MHSGTLTVSLSALKKNYQIFQKTVGVQCQVAPAVKANAYGLGLDHCAPALYDAGARLFFVATLDEALALRTIIPNCEIAVLGGLLPGSAPDYQAHTLIPVLNDLAQCAYWESFQKQAYHALRAFLHIDTGMNRLGLKPEEATDLFNNSNRMNALNIALCMSHFVSADEKDHPITTQQYQNFNTAFQTCPPPIRASLANSSGIFRDSCYHFDCVRPGMGLYGLNPTPETKNPMHQVTELHVPILQIHSAKKGQSAGYGQGYVFDQDTPLATISLGYADGFLRHLSNAATVYWQGIPCPVRGRISMDLSIIDLSAMPAQQRPQVHDTVEILGPHQSADDLANHAGTIGYEILTALGGRYKRQYTL